MIYRITAFILFLLAVLPSRGQSEIYISNAARDINIVSIANNNCSQVNVVNTDRSLSDITLHPNGKMYGCNFSNRTIYEVDLSTGTTTSILTIAEANRLVGMTADANGLLYVTEGEIIPSDLYVVDPVMGTYVNKGPLADGSAGDLTWSFGKLYNASDNNKLVEVNIEDPASSIVIGDFIGIAQPGDRIFGLVSVFTSCVETESFGLSEFGDYYSLDLNTALVSRLCIGSINNYGATSADEFLASECFIGIDLDQNNSAGLIGNDFQSDFDCPGTSAPVADDDAFVLVSSQVDSLIVSISSGVQDGVDEFLEVGSSPNLTISNFGFFLTAISTGSSTMDVETFLSTLRYRNTAIPASTGLREITVIGYSEDKSDTAYAYIYLEGFDVGLPDQAAICPGGSYLIDADIGSGTASYSWSTGETTSQITVLVAGEYWVTVTDGSCQDTDTIMVTEVVYFQVDLGEDTVLCEGGSLTLDADLMVPTADYTWSTGETGPVIEVSSSGSYSVIAAIGGCSFGDTIEVIYSDFTPDLGDDFTLCTGDNVTLNADLGLPDVSYEWSTGALIPVINITSGGVYWVTASDQYCSSSDTIIVTEVSGGEIEFSLGPDQTICLGENATFSSGFSPAIYDHTWSTGSNNPSITTSSEGTYMLTLSNQCQSGSDTVELFIEDCDTIIDPPDTTIVDPPDTTVDPPDTIDIPEIEVCDLKFPTAFSPNGDGYNDVFGLLNLCPEFTEYEIRVYNRYGEEVFKGNELSFWDGSYQSHRVPLDTFIWYARARDGTGVTRSWRGNVLVLR